MMLRKVRTGKGTRLWKAQWGVIFKGRNRKEPPGKAFGLPVRVKTRGKSPRRRYGDIRRVRSRACKTKYTGR